MLLLLLRPNRIDYAVSMGGRIEKFWVRYMLISMLVGGDIAAVVTMVQMIGTLCSKRAGEIDLSWRIFEDYEQLSAIESPGGHSKQYIDGVVLKWPPCRDRKVLERPK